MNDENDQTPPAQTPGGAAAYERVGSFLVQDGWYPQKNEEKSVYRMVFEGQNGEQRCFAQIRQDLEQLVFYAVAPIKVPEVTRAAVAEFITRANYGMRIGNFELDLTDGEVRYKSSLDFEGSSLDEALIRNVIYPAVQTMDRYIPGIMAVAFGNREPATVIAEIEG